MQAQPFSSFDADAQATPHVQESAQLDVRLGVLQPPAAHEDGTMQGQQQELRDRAAQASILPVVHRQQSQMQTETAALVETGTQARLAAGAGLAATGMQTGAEVAARGASHDAATQAVRIHPQQVGKGFAHLSGDCELHCRNSFHFWIRLTKFCLCLCLKTFCAETCQRSC